MKKIIAGKVYDTEKATQIGFEQNTGDYRDLYWVCESLYRKRTGEYFLHGEGGPATKYSVLTGSNSWSGGEKILPLSYGEAKSWAQDHLSSDVYEVEFGEIKEDETSETITISIPTSSAAKLRRSAHERGVGLSAYIASLA